MLTTSMSLLLRIKKTSYLQIALFNNVLGLLLGTTGGFIFEQEKNQFTSLYTNAAQIKRQKITALFKMKTGFKVISNK